MKTKSFIIINECHINSNYSFTEMPPCQLERNFAFNLHNLCASIFQHEMNAVGLIMGILVIHTHF